MESHLQRPYGHPYNDPQNAPAVHSVVEDEGEHHHEKKSVLKKVKAKAKKIKDTLTKHGRGHEHEPDQERDYHHDDHDEEEEDEDEEIVEDPEIHVYESAAVRIAAVPCQDINLEKPTAIGKNRYGTKSSEVAARPGEQGQQQYSGKSGMDLGRPTAMEVARAAEDKNVSFPPEIHGTRVSHPSVTDKKDLNMDQQAARIGKLEDLEEDPNYARPGTILVSNYEIKVTDPTGKGGEEAEMSPLIRSLDKMSVSDESVPKPKAKWEHRGYTGSHDQFAPQPFPTADEFAPKPLPTSSSQGSRESTPKSYDHSKPEELPRDTLMGKSSDKSGYIEKISAATFVIADKAVSAKNVVASKLGYGGTEGAKGQEIGEGKQAAKSASPTEYAHKVVATVTGKLAPVYDKVADAGSSVISKVKGTSYAGKDEGPEMRSEGEGKVADKGLSVKQYLAEKFKPSDDDKALSEVITESWHKKKEELGKTGETKPMGKVTETEEVERQLGSGTEKKREGDDAAAAGSESTGMGVMDRIKNALSLWVGKVGDERSATSEVR